MADPHIAHFWFFLIFVCLDPPPLFISTKKTLFVQMDIMLYRAQLRIRGQRFEASAELLCTFCTTFRAYFSSSELEKYVAKANDGEMSSMPPLQSVLLPPSTVELDTSKKLFLFDFSQPAATSASSAASSSSKSNTAASLDAEYVGVILVFLRKLSKNPEARLTARWDEMPHDQQRSFANVVRAFGVLPLLEKYSAATAEGGAAALEPTPTEKMLHGGRSLIEVAHEYLAKQQQVDQPHPSEGDDNLTLPAEGCAKCGTSGHGIGSCPY